jgi:hypothetical protein
MRNTIYVCDVTNAENAVDVIVFSTNEENGRASCIVLGESVIDDVSKTVNISDSDDSYSVDVAVEDIDMLIVALKKAKELHTARYAKKPVSPKRAAKKS